MIFSVATRPLVSIVVPTDDRENARACISGIFAHTSYDRFEIVVVTRSALAAELEAEFASSGVRCVAYDGIFNFSLKLNNLIEYCMNVRFLSLFFF